MQTRNPLFDDLAKLMTNAAGVAQGMREEMESVARSQIERFAGRMDLARRDEVDAAMELAATARAEVEALERRVAALEAALEAALAETRESAAPTRPRKSAAKPADKSEEKPVGKISDAENN